jgi:hypothetical protein
MALDSVAQVKAVYHYVEKQGISSDLISRGDGSRSFFHYTDYNAFASIVTNKDLWLTDAGFSNDAEELKNGRLLIAAVIEDQAKAGKTPEVRSLASDVAKLEADEESQEILTHGVYVCCFCENGDLLSQWRGYAANGGGVAIGIDSEAFSWLSGIDNPTGVMSFWKVSYDDKVKRRRVQDVLEFWAREPGQPDVRAESAAATLQFFVPTFKNPSFEAEAEWRLIFSPGPTCEVRPKFRTARGLFMPYLELSAVTKTFQNPKQDTAGWLVIKSVCIGPGPYKDVNTLSAERLLKSYGITDAKVDRSKIPYRG